MNDILVSACHEAWRAGKPAGRARKALDSEDLKGLIARRNASKNKTERKLICIGIFKLRKSEQKARKSLLCEKVGALHWGCRPELDSMLNRERGVCLPSALRTPVDFKISEQHEQLTQAELSQMEKATHAYNFHQWPEQSCKFWSHIAHEQDQKACDEVKAHLDNLHMQCVVLQMANRLDGMQPPPLIDGQLVKENLKKLKNHKANDPSGCTSEILRVVEDSEIVSEHLACVFDDRTCRAPPPLDRPCQENELHEWINEHNDVSFSPSSPPPPSRNCKATGSSRSNCKGDEGSKSGVGDETPIVGLGHPRFQPKSPPPGGGDFGWNRRLGFLVATAKATKLRIMVLVDVSLVVLVGKGWVSTTVTRWVATLIGGIGSLRFSYKKSVPPALTSIDPLVFCLSCLNCS